MEFSLDDHESYKVRIVKREKMTLTTTMTLYVEYNGEYKKLKTSETIDKEMFGDKIEEDTKRSGKWIKQNTEKSKRKRTIDSSFEFESSSRSPQKRQKTVPFENVYNSTNNEGDKENRSIIDEIIPDSASTQKPIPDLADALNDVFGDNAVKSTPLKMLSPNKLHKPMGMTTPEKFTTPPRNTLNKAIVSPVMKDLVTKNLHQSFETTPTTSHIPRHSQSTPDKIKHIHSRSSLHTPNKSPSSVDSSRSRSLTPGTLSYQTIDSIPCRPFNYNNKSIHEKSSDRWKHIKLLDQSSRIEELDDSSFINENDPDGFRSDEIQEPEPPQMPKKPDNRELKIDTLIWAKYGDAFYPAFVREILDARSPNVKVSYCDQGIH
jgi:hypothetical protein